MNNFQEHFPFLPRLPKNLLNTFWGGLLRRRFGSKHPMHKVFGRLGGWTNPFEKYDRPIGSYYPGIGGDNKTNLWNHQLPAPPKRCQYDPKGWLMGTPYHSFSTPEVFQVEKHLSNRHWCPHFSCKTTGWTHQSRPPCQDVAALVRVVGSLKGLQGSGLFLQLYLQKQCAMCKPYNKKQPKKTIIGTVSRRYIRHPTRAIKFISFSTIW